MSLSNTWPTCFGTRINIQELILLVLKGDSFGQPLHDFPLPFGSPLFLVKKLCVTHHQRWWPAIGLSVVESISSWRTGRGFSPHNLFGMTNLYVVLFSDCHRSSDVEGLWVVWSLSCILETLRNDHIAICCSASGWKLLLRNVFNYWLEHSKRSSYGRDWHPLPAYS